MFRELRIDRVVFEEIVNAVVDLPLQRRGRRSFIFSNDESVVFSRIRRAAFFKNCLRAPTRQTLDFDNKVNPNVADGLGPCGGLMHRLLQGSRLVICDLKKALYNNPGRSAVMISKVSVLNGRENN